MVILAFVDIQFMLFVPSNWSAVRTPPTAIFCGTDRIAMGAYQALAERGLSIPGDVAIMGFDDQEVIAAYLRPSLTTIALPHYAMGQ